MRRLLLLCCAVLFFSACESTLPEAGEMTLQTRSAIEVLPANAAIVGMLNFQRAFQNTLTGPITTEFQDVENGEFRAFLDATGFDPQRDLQQVYVAVGPEADNTRDVQMVVYADVDRARFASAIEAHSEGQLAQRTYRDATIYTSQEGKMNFALVNDEMIAVASSSVAMDAMLDRLAGQGTALKTDRELMDLIALVPYPDGAWVVTRNLPQPGIAQARAEDGMEHTMQSLAQMIEDGVMSVNFDDEEVNVALIAATREGIRAGDAADLVKGAISMARQQANEEVRRTLDRARVQTRANRVEVYVDLDEQTWQQLRGNH